MYKGIFNTESGLKIPFDASSFSLRSLKKEGITLPFGDNYNHIIYVGVDLENIKDYQDIKKVIYNLYIQDCRNDFTLKLTKCENLDYSDIGLSYPVESEIYYHNQNAIEYYNNNIYATISFKKDDLQYIQAGIKYVPIDITELVIEKLKNSERYLIFMIWANSYNDVMSSVNYDFSYVNHLHLGYGNTMYLNCVYGYYTIPNISNRLTQKVSLGDAGNLLIDLKKWNCLLSLNTFATNRSVNPININMILDLSKTNTNNLIIDANYQLNESEDQAYITLTDDFGQIKHYILLSGDELNNVIKAYNLKDTDGYEKFYFSVDDNSFIGNTGADYTILNNNRKSKYNRLDNSAQLILTEECIDNDVHRYNRNGNNQITSIEHLWVKKDDVYDTTISEVVNFLYNSSNELYRIAFVNEKKLLKIVRSNDAIKEIIVVSDNGITTFFDLAIDYAKQLITDKINDYELWYNKTETEISYKFNSGQIDNATYVKVDDKIEVTDKLGNKSIIQCDANYDVLKVTSDLSTVYYAKYIDENGDSNLITRSGQKLKNLFGSDNSFSLIGNGAETTKVVKEIVKQGNANDEYSFIVGGKANRTIYRNFAITVKFVYNGKEDAHTFKFDRLREDYHYLINSVRSNSCYNKIVVEASVDGFVEAFAEIISFSKTNTNSFYNYNQKQELSNVELNSEDVKIEYDHGNIKSIKDFYGEFYEFSQDIYKQGDYESAMGQEKQKTTLNSRYNPINILNITKNGLNQNAEYEYFDNSDLIKKITVGENVTEYVYNGYNDITEIYTNDGMMQKFSYNGYGKIYLSYLYNYLEEKDEYEKVSGIVYDYDDKTVTVTGPVGTENTTIYYYDNYNRLLEVVHNEKTIKKYTYFEPPYNERSMLDYNVSLNGIDYQVYYDKYGRMLQTIEGTIDNPNAKKYVYNYNDNLLASIRYFENGNLKQEITYEYDEANNLIKSKTNTQETSYSCDNLQYLQQKIITIDDDNLLVQYDNLYESDISSLQEYFKNFSYDTTNDFMYPNTSKKTFFDAEPVKSNVEVVYDKDLESNIYAFKNTNSCLSYQKHYTDSDVKGINENRLNKKYQNNVFDSRKFNDEYFYKNFVGGWFRVEDNQLSDVPLFTIKYSNHISIMLYVGEFSKLWIKYIGKDCVFEKRTEFVVNGNEWNYVEMYYNNSKIYLRFNYQDIYYDAENIKEIIEQDREKILKDEIKVQYMTISIGDFEELSKDVKLTDIRKLEVCYLSFGTEPIIGEQSRNLYDRGKYLLENGRTKQRTNSLFYNSDIYKDFILIPLNGTFDSKAQLMEYSDVSDYNFKDSKKLFAYDDDVKRFVYRSSKDLSLFKDSQQSNLKYKIELEDKGLISMWVKLDPLYQYDNGYLISNVNETTKKVIWGAFIDNNCEVRLVNNLDVKNSTTGIETKQYIQPGVWTFICFRWNGNQLYLKINDNDFIKINCTISGLSNCVTYIGNTLGYVGGYYIPNKQFEGSIEMFAYRSEIKGTTSDAVIENLYKCGSPINYVTKYDSISRIKEDNIYTKNQTLTHYYRYNDLNNNLNHYPHHEIDFQNNIITYEYNQYGNIISKIVGTVNNETIERYDYEYDDYQRLTSERCESLENSIMNYIMNYTYDQNGNILTIIKKDLNNIEMYSKTFTYNGNLLQTLTTDNIVTNFQFNANGELTTIVKGVESTNLVWSAGKLQSYGNSTFEYNENGDRTKKTTNGVDTKYFYDDKKIIRSVKNNVITNYLYDVNNLLVGLTINGKEYFYQRDLTGIINKIVDENGTIVVEYKYDAYGNILSIVGNETVVDNNIFLYKGYCYDVETGLFWLSSRHYSPELGRFIQPAEVSSLNPQSINRLNLYAYANNNPVSNTKLTVSAHISMTNVSKMINVVPNVNSIILDVGSKNKNYWDPHVKGKWFDTDVPEFFNFTHDKIEFVNWSFSVYKGSLYFDHNENHSLYIAGGNISTYLGIGSDGVGLDVGANVLEIGYDGRIIDANVEFLTVGLTFMYKDGTFEFGVGAGWFGYSVTIDIDEIIKIIFGG